MIPQGASSGQDSLFKLLETLQHRAPEYVELLTAPNDVEFDAALDKFIERAISHMEANAGNIDTLSETGLTAFLAAELNMPGVRAVQEAHSNGHVDITITVSELAPKRERIGEAKIWRGAGYHIDGVKQILGRYATGRNRRVFMFSYVKQENIKGLIAKLRAEMDREKPSKQQSPTSDHSVTWSFLSRHGHSSGETVEVCHFSLNLYVPE